MAALAPVAAEEEEGKALVVKALFDEMGCAVDVEGCVAGVVVDVDVRGLAAGVDGVLPGFRKDENALIVVVFLLLLPSLSRRRIQGTAFVFSFVRESLVQIGISRDRGKIFKI